MLRSSNLIKLFALCLTVSIIACSDADLHKIPEKMTVKEKKQRFLDLIEPHVTSVYQELEQSYRQVKTAIDADSRDMQNKIAELQKTYNVNNNKDLLLALKPHPPSVVLAQAAIESAWATSRFFVKANNIFGVWSFNEDEPRIAAAEKRGNKTIWLKKYSSIRSSIESYYKILATGDAFKDFRALRMTSNDPYKLVTKLDKYSEKGDEYGKELSAIIRHNKFTNFDPK